MKVRPFIRRVVGLTGTPSSNGLMDLYAEFKVLDMGKRLGRFIGQYRNAYFRPDRTNGQMVYSYKLLPGADEKIYDRISDITISMKGTDYLDMPELVNSRYKVYMDADEEEAYEGLKKEFVLSLPGGEVTAANAAALSGKLLQIANGAIYRTTERYEDDRVIESRETVEIHGNKVEAFLELVEELNGRHALVFYNFRHDLLRLEKALAKSGLRMSELKGPEDISDWNGGKTDILFAHPASVAYGLNLQEGGSDVIWFGLNYSLELYQQANARLHRQGQKRTVCIHHLVVEGSVDEDVINALQKKSDCQAALLEALKARVEKYKA